jgi:hypothetical protein
MIRIAAPLALLLASTSLSAAPPTGASPDELHTTIAKLVGFGTRHTLSSPTDPKRGIGAARAWTADRFAAIGKDCGGCLTVEKVAERFTGARAPDGVEIVNILGVLKGTDHPNRVVILSAHIDSRVTDVMNATADAPGANDDGSGVALVIEAARLLSKQRHDATIIFAILSGEEQGLFGGQLLARTAKARGWQVTAQLNNDIVGNSHGIGGEHIDNRVRVFSEGIRSSEGPDESKNRRGIGGEDDGPSRALAKYVDQIGVRSKAGLDVLAIRRPDRFQRGGDHSPLLDAGYPAVRISEATENYDRQHQDLRTENGRAFGDTIDGVDFPYLAKVTNLNVAAARALADAPAAPATATIKGALSDDTTVKWSPVTGATGYRIYWRRADGADWTDHRDVQGGELVLKNINIDDNFFGVAAVGAHGDESLITFAAGEPRK